MKFTSFTFLFILPFHARSYYIQVLPISIAAWKETERLKKGTKSGADLPAWFLLIFSPFME
jgi:hypothetical protein